MTQTQIENLKQLLREGSYWQALQLPPNSPWSTTAICIAKTEQMCLNDAETLDLLATIREDICNAGYIPAGRLCDDIAKRFGEEFHHRLIKEDRLLKESLWQDCIREMMSDLTTADGIISAKSSIGWFLRNRAIALANKTEDSLFNKQISEDIAAQALNKSVVAIEIACQYMPEDDDLANDLVKIKEETANLYCGRGIQRINQAQKRFFTKMENLASRNSGGSPASINETTRRFFVDTKNEINAGIADLNRAVVLDNGNKKAGEQLKIAQQILNSIEQKNTEVNRLNQENNLVEDFERGISRINEATKKLNDSRQALLARIRSGNITDLLKEIPQSYIFEYKNTSRPEVLLSALVAKMELDHVCQAIDEVKDGITDMEKVRKTLPRNKHIVSQLDQANKLLKDLNKELAVLESKASLPRKW